MVTSLYCTPDEARALEMERDGYIGVCLFGVSGRGVPGLGHRAIQAAKGLPTQVSRVAWDFLSIALSVQAADRFVLRNNSADGWTRQIALHIEVRDPEPWQGASELLADALRFVTGDIWKIEFERNGANAPTIQDGRLTDRDCACLFSGGMDSFIGASNLLQEGRRPILVSQGRRIETMAQNYLSDSLGLSAHRFAANSSERIDYEMEPSQRGRSLLFVGYGVAVASTLPARNGRRELFIPENGFIAVNPPLTRRRIGTLSTRTAHPHFLRALQQVLDTVGINVSIQNPYVLNTKGQMLQTANHPMVRRHAKDTWSCGKGNRINKHCGQCIPCIIRRASFHAAGLQDRTNYKTRDLATAVDADDVRAIRYAIWKFRDGLDSATFAAAGPFPIDLGGGAVFNDVVQRGLVELDNFLNEFAWP